MHSKRWIHIAKILGIAVVLFASISFVEKQYSDRVCRGIVVHIDDQLANYFINEQDVTEIITNSGRTSIIGQSLDALQLKSLERMLEEHKFVRKAEVYKDLKGNLVVNIDQTRPIARLTSARRRDRYISDEGEIVPVSSRYTARVLLIRGAIAEKENQEPLTHTSYGSKLHQLLQYIDQDRFWKGQIAEMHIAADGDISMLTQVSKQKIEFGQPEEFDEKFRKLKIFYKTILPAKGWNTYERVSVKFRNQIVCE
jgi:cell division protein FtsQ